MLSIVSAFTIDGVVALPSSAPTPGLSSVTPAASSLPAFPTVRSTHLFVAQLGQPLRNDCDAASALLPHDPPGQPVLRNFYINASDMSDTRPNQLLPLEVAFGTLPSTAST